jgi:flagellar L-ring protein precursor FlgH
MKIITVTILLALSLSGCVSSQVDRLKWVGKAPPMSESKIPDEKQSSVPIKWPSTAKQDNKANIKKNSLWSDGARQFFADKRAKNAGDILTVNVAISDKADLNNKTERTRAESDKLGIPKLFGAENNLLIKNLPGTPDPSNLLSKSSNLDNKGEGSIGRQEKIETKVAAVVTQVTNNGNLVIYGSQEIRVNNEIRQLTVEGVVRPDDITPQNTVDAERIAEARISYGGRGLISDVQQPRIGNQVIDIITPF